MLNLLLIILSIIIGLRTVTGASKIDFGGYGSKIYFVVIVCSISYFVYQLLKSLSKGNKGEAFYHLGSILLVIIGIAASVLTLIFILNNFQK